MPITTHVLYRDILKKALFIVWRNRPLWILGFFASFLALGGVSEIIFRSGLAQTAWLNKITSFSGLGIFMGANWDLVTPKSIAALVLAAVICTVAILAFLWLVIASFAALIKSASVLDQKKQIKFYDTFLEERYKFWPLLGINVLGKSLIAAFLLAIGALLYTVSQTNDPLKSLLFFISFLALAAASIVLSFLIIYASAFVVLKNHPFLAAIREAWLLFKKNWVVSLEAAAILFGVNLLVKFVIFIFMILSAIPFMLLLVFGYFAAADFLPFAVLAVWATMAILFIILAGSFFSAYQIVAWTFVFDKIAKGKIISKLHRIFR